MHTHTYSRQHKCCSNDINFPKKFSLFAKNFMVGHIAKYSVVGVFANISQPHYVSGFLRPILLACAYIPCSDSVRKDK